MKTLCAKTMALVLTPLLALAPLTPVLAQTGVAKEGSAEFAAISEARLEEILSTAQTSTGKSATDADRQAGIDRIKSILSTLTPEEKLRLVSSTLESIPKIQREAWKAADVSASVLVPFLIALVIIDSTSGKAGKSSVFLAAATLTAVGSLASSVNLAYQTGIAKFVVLENIEELRQALFEIQGEILLEIRAKNLN